MSSSAPPRPPPIITIYRNGDRHFIGKKLVVNQKYYRSFENFLDKVTLDTKSGIAIRKIHTPNGGTKIGTLEKIQNGAIYVAAGTERFRRLKYGAEGLKGTGTRNETILPVIHSKIVGVSRYKQEAMAEPLKNRIIFVYRNGEEKTPPVKLLLDKRTLRNLSSVLQYISDKVNLTAGAVKNMYSMESGTKIKDVSQIHTNLSYIAVGSGKQLSKGNYINNNSNNTISPRRKVVDGSIKSKITKMKKVANEEANRVITSLSAPEDDRPISTQELIISPEQEENNENGLNASQSNDKSYLDKILSSIDDNVNKVDEPLPSTVNDLASGYILNNDTESNHGESNEIISPEVIKEMSGTPPVTVLSGDKSSFEIAETTNVDSHATDIDVNRKKDEPINDIENPPFTSSPLINTEDKKIVDVNENNELQMDSNNDITEELINHNDEVSRTHSVHSSVEKSNNVTENELSTIQNDEQPMFKASDKEPDLMSSTDSVSSVEENEDVTEEQPIVYKASGVQKESGEQVKDDKETVVEKLIDMVPAEEVEENLEADNEVSDFYSH